MPIVVAIIVIIFVCIAIAILSASKKDKPKDSLANGRLKEYNTVESSGSHELFQQATPDYVPSTPDADSPAYVFLDVETTGLNLQSDAIVQVSALRYLGEKFIDGVNTYINPGFHIPQRASDLHGITDEIVKDAPCISDVKDPILNIFKNAVLVGYNVTFDLNFLDKAFQGALDGVKYIDVMNAAKTLISLPNYKLETVADYVGFRPEGGYHNSLNDCLATAAVFFRLEVNPTIFDEIYCSKYSEEIQAEIYESDAVGEPVPYMDALREICKQAGLDIDLHSSLTSKGFDVTHNRYLWFRFKLTGKLHYLLVPLKKSEAEDLLAESGILVKDAVASEAPDSHCRVMIETPQDLFLVAPAIVSAIKQLSKYTN